LPFETAAATEPAIFASPSLPKPDLTIFFAFMVRAFSTRFTAATLGELDDNLDGELLGETLGELDGFPDGEVLGSALGEMDGKLDVLDQTSWLSKPHPEPLVHPASSSVLVHRRPPASSQSSLAVPKEVVWQSGLRELAHTSQCLRLCHPGNLVPAQQRTWCFSATPAGISSPSLQPVPFPQISQNWE